MAVTTMTRHVQADSPRAGRLVGTGHLLRFALRRDRVLLPIWIVGFALMVAVSVMASVGLYTTQQERIEASAAINSTAALVALYGKVYVPTSLGALSLIKLTAFGAAMVGVMFVFLTIRHTRTEEESGRLDLLAAGVVGRLAPLTAALLYGLIGSIALGALTTVGLLAAGMNPAGSMAFGLSWTMTGLVFTAVAAVAAQLTVSHRTAIGLGIGAVAVAYALRAVGDLAESDPGWLSWLSPIGWSQQIRPFAGDRWWVAGLSTAAVLMLVPLALWLRSRRDLGCGLLPDRSGPARGRVTTLPGLAWRLQRGVITAWFAVLLIMGFVLGSVAQNVSGLLDSEQMRVFLEMLGGEQALVNAFLAAEIAMLGIAISAFAISAVLRLRGEETSGRADLLLAAPARHTGWALSHYGIALMGAAVLLVTAGLAVGLGHGLAIGEPLASATSLAGAAAAQLPAVAVMAAMTLVLWSVWPQISTLMWALLVAFIVIGEFGALWGLPEWVLQLSPFAHSPILPGQPVPWGGVVGLVMAAFALTALALTVIGRRDIRP